ncbi:hypothetical protein HY030_02280 [Candidatus Gottesmanbacteria bacterium]|nr:hypothetical protein [Candidatus Gottesmanbacteria bacterium]
MFIVLIIVIGVLNFFYLTPPVINWDEGTHAIWGFREWLALKDGNLLGFWQFSQSQFAYPPFGSWLITFLNFPFEFSMNLTRFVSTLGFIFGGILLYLLSKQLFSQKRVLPELVLPEVVLIRRLADKKLGQNSLRHPFFSLKYQRGMGSNTNTFSFLFIFSGLDAKNCSSIFLRRIGFGFAFF